MSLSRKGHGGLDKAPRKRKAKRREIRSSLLILALKDGKLNNNDRDRI